MKCLQTFEVVVLVSTQAFAESTTIKPLVLVLVLMLGLGLVLLMQAKLGCLNMLGTTVMSSSCTDSLCLVSVGPACQVTATVIKCIITLCRTAV